MLKYILIISLILNFSFLGAAGYTHYKQSTYRRPPTMHELHADGSHLFEALALKPEQLKVFQEKAVPFHEAIAKKRQEVERMRSELFGLMRADRPDQKAIVATIGRINKAQEEMQKTVVAHMLEFKSMLDTEQQKKFLDLIEGAMKEHREAMCP